MLSNCKGNVVNRMNLEQYKGVFIYAQQVDNKIDAIALELLGKANDLAADLGTDVTAVLIGSDVKGLVDELAEYGADKVIVVDDPELKEYRTEPYAHALASVINEYKPEIMLVGATAIGRDLGPTVSELRQVLQQTVLLLKSEISHWLLLQEKNLSRNTISC